MYKKKKSSHRKKGLFPKLKKTLLKNWIPPIPVHKSSCWVKSSSYWSIFEDLPGHLNLAKEKLWNERVELGFQFHSVLSNIFCFFAHFMKWLVTIYANAMRPFHR